MKHYAAILAVLALLPAAACAPVPPKPDPVKEELVVLQKQLLELQKLQNDTKARLDESTSTIDSLSTKIRMLEARQVAQPVMAPPADPKPMLTAQAKKAPVTDKKKPAKKPVKKKKKKVRRQE